MEVYIVCSEDGWYYGSPNLRTRNREEATVFATAKLAFKARLALGADWYTEIIPVKTY